MYDNMLINIEPLYFIRNYLWSTNRRKQTGSVQVIPFRLNEIIEIYVAF